jgi:phosphatidylglycerophosphate synthase
MFREVFIVAAYAWLLGRGIEMRVDMAGKVSSALTMVATGGAILLDQAWVDALFWASVALAIATLLNYSREAAIALRARRVASTRP